MPFLSFNYFERVINAFVSSRLDYWNALLVGVSQTSLSWLQLVQNAAARPLTGARRQEHISLILQSPHWLPVSFRINFKILLFTFKALNGLAPSYLSSLLHPCVSSRALRFADRSLLAVSKTQLKQRGDRAFAVVAPKLWNKLPLQIRLEPTMPVFKSHLKTHLFSQAFSVSVWMRVALWTEFCVLNSC